MTNTEERQMKTAICATGQDIWRNDAAMDRLSVYAIGQTKLNGLKLLGRNQRCLEHDKDNTKKYVGELEDC